MPTELAIHSIVIPTHRSDDMRLVDEDENIVKTTATVCEKLLHLVYPGVRVDANLSHCNAKLDRV